MKIQENYFYKLDNSKEVKVIWKKYDKANILEVGIEYPTAIVDLDRFTGIKINGDWLLNLGFKMELGLIWKNWSRITLDKVYDCYLLSLDNVVVRPVNYVHELQEIFFGITGEDLVLSNIVNENLQQNTVSSLNCPTCNGDSWMQNLIQSEKKYCKCGAIF
jgi:hypothetical protein